MYLKLTKQFMHLKFMCSYGRNIISHNNLLLPFNSMTCILIIVTNYIKHLHFTGI
jgi:hypothetical protein